MESLKVLGIDITHKQYFAYLTLAKKTPEWNTKSEEWRKGVLMGIITMIE